MSRYDSSSRSGLSTWDILLIVFIVLKLIGVINWGWGWVLALVTKYLVLVVADFTQAQLNLALDRDAVFLVYGLAHADDCHGVRPART